MRDRVVADVEADAVVLDFEHDVPADQLGADDQMALAVLEGVLDGVLHDGLQDQFERRIVEEALVRLEAHVHPVREADLVDLQKVRGQLELLADRDELVPLVQREAEKFGEVDGQLLDLRLLFQARHPGDGVQRVVQEVRVDLHLQRFQLELALHLGVLAVFLDEAEEVGDHLVVLLFQHIQLVPLVRLPQPLPARADGLLDVRVEFGDRLGELFGAQDGDEHADQKDGDHDADQQPGQKVERPVIVTVIEDADEVIFPAVPLVQPLHRADVDDLLLVAHLQRAEARPAVQLVDIFIKIQFSHVVLIDVGKDIAVLADDIGIPLLRTEPGQVVGDRRFGHEKDEAALRFGHAVVQTDDEGVAAVRIAADDDAVFVLLRRQKDLRRGRGVAVDGEIAALVLPADVAERIRLGERGEIFERAHPHGVAVVAVQILQRVRVGVADDARIGVSDLVDRGDDVRIHVAVIGVEVVADVAAHGRGHGELYDGEHDGEDARQHRGEQQDEFRAQFSFLHGSNRYIRSA